MKITRSQLQRIIQEEAFAVIDEAFAEREGLPLNYNSSIAAKQDLYGGPSTKGGPPSAPALTKGVPPPAVEIPQVSADRPPVGPTAAEPLLQRRQVYTRHGGSGDAEVQRLRGEIEHDPETRAAWASEEFDPNDISSWDETARRRVAAAEEEENLVWPALRAGAHFISPFAGLGVDLANQAARDRMGLETNWWDVPLNLATRGLYDVGRAAWDRLTEEIIDQEIDLLLLENKLI
tara:strand:+ start:83 stop:784 length:702 start_codon:yes stop_codon:yes gene_type:complete